jgi:hypothetical protein
MSRTWNTSAYFGYKIAIPPDLRVKYEEACSLDSDFRNNYSYEEFFANELRRRRSSLKDFSVVGILKGMETWWLEKERPTDEDVMDGIVVGMEIKDGDDLRILQDHVTRLKEQLVPEKWPELVDKRPEIYSGFLWLNDYVPEPLPVDKWTKAYGWDLSSLSKDDQKAWWEIELDGYDIKGFIDLKDGRRLSFGILAWRKERFQKLIETYSDHPLVKEFREKPIEEFIVEDDYGDAAYDSGDEGEGEDHEISGDSK